jgi:hypothetical protein
MFLLAQLPQHTVYEMASLLEHGSLVRPRHLFILAAKTSPPDLQCRYWAAVFPRTVASGGGILLSEVYSLVSRASTEVGPFPRKTKNFAVTQSRETGFPTLRD